MFSASDTIVAVATPPGRGGIGVVRLSGPEAQRITQRLTTRSEGLEPRRATFARIRAAGSADDGLSDHVVATYYPGPSSYTGDDVVEVSAHGSPVVLRAIVSAAMAEGARLAEPGEFTLRAFLNGRIDLTQAEAVADLIDAVTPLQARTAFDQLEGTLTRAIGELDASLFDLIARLEASIDFPDEGYHFIEPGTIACAIDAITARLTALLADTRRGRLIREGFTAAIVGKPNVGKSSLFNALVGASRAIVTEVPGTTRDLLTEAVDIEGFRVTLVDSAGLRPTTDAVEREGVERARQAQSIAEVILVVLDRSAPLDPSDQEILSCTGGRNRIVVANKADVDPAWTHIDAVPVSARTGEGIDGLRRRLAAALDDGSTRDRPQITNVRHAALLEQARVALERARAAAGSPERALPEEFVLADLQQARAVLEEITGRRAPDAMLDHIFSRFCVGK